MLCSVVPLYWPSSVGAETLRLRCMWFSGAPSLCSELVGDVSGSGRLSCPRSALFSVSSFLISSCSCWMTRARPRPLSIMRSSSTVLGFCSFLSFLVFTALPRPFHPSLIVVLLVLSVQISAVILYRRDYVAFHRLYSS